MQVKADRAVHTAEQFDARGLVVLTASDSTEYAFDGDVVRGSVTPSRFTATLVDGLSSGEADLDRDGFVSVDDAYDFVSRRLADDEVPQRPRKWEFDVAGHIVLARTEPAAGADPQVLVPPPAAVAALPVSRALTRPGRLLRPPWWLASLAMLASCVALTWLVVTWLSDVLADSVPAEYLPDLGALRWSVVGLAVAWILAYAIVGRPAALGDRVGWGQPWRPLRVAYRDLLGANGARSFPRGLVSALPVNVLLVGAASIGAAALAYANSGSEQRDNLFRLAFALLAVGGIVAYLTWEREPSR